LVKGGSSKSGEVWAVIVAGGASRRMGRNKLTLPLVGRPVLSWSIGAFNDCPEVDGIVLVCSSGARDELEEIARVAAPQKLEAVVEGGAHRHLSVLEGMQAVPASASIIAVHDAARPLVTLAMIDRCLAEAVRSGAAACARRVTDTLKRTNDEGFIIDSVDRQGLWAMETPQIFRGELLRQAYREVVESQSYVTDETSAVQAVGAPIALVETAEWNGKITFPADLELAEEILRGRGQS